MHRKQFNKKQSCLNGKAAALPPQSVAAFRHSLLTLPSRRAHAISLVITYREYEDKTAMSQPDAVGRPRITVSYTGGERANRMRTTLTSRSLRLFEGIQLSASF